MFISQLLSAQNIAERWADSISRTMTAEEKVRQLFVFPVTPGQINPLTGLISQIENQKPGGILLTSGGPVANALLLNRLQASAKIPLLVAVQAEWGLSQTLDSVSNLPVPVILGATSDSLAYVTGVLAARQMKSIGAHLNIGLNADADVPGTPSTVAFRYISDKSETVTSRLSSYLKGLNKEGMLGGLRHIPGKEDISLSDYTSASRFYADSVSFLSFTKLLNAGAKSLNTSYLHYVVRQKNKWIPVVQSKEFIPTVRKATGFEGLFISEIPFFQSFSNKKNGDPELMAFENGHDLLLAPLHPDAAVRKILKLVRKKPEFEAQLNASVRRILLAKFEAGVNRKKEYSGKFSEDLSKQIRLLNYSANSSAVTIIKNEKKLLPIENLSDRNFYLIDFGGYSIELQNSFLRYAPFTVTSFKSLSDTVGLQNLKKEDVLIIALSDQNEFKDMDLSKWLNKINNQTNLILLHSGNPYRLDEFKNLPTIVEGYYPSGTESYSAQIIFGALPASGKIPIVLSSKEITGLNTLPLNRLAYSVPEAVGMSSETLFEIDGIASEAIESGATPGCRVLIARNGKVVFNRSYGSLTYENKTPVGESTIYDLASVTKVSATLQATMYLYDKGIIDLQKKASYYLPELRNSNKRDFTLKDILTHQAGLWPYLPFWTQTIKDGKLLTEYYDSVRSEEYPFEVSKNLFAINSIRDSLWSWIVKARIVEKKDRTPFTYRYSDMGFYLLQHLFEKLDGRPMEDFLDIYLYKPIGAYTTGYLPLKKFSEKRIAPTEDDRGYRKSLLTGYVHDQGAAMHGGVAGHAGLFSNANDLAKLGQMWLQNGYYGGRQYFSKEALQLFTSRTYQNSRRGLGWDKPWPEDLSSTPTGALASPKTFGHTGFTGTSIWVDPDNQLVYVFLSNRVHPDMNNAKLINANIRTRIHDVAYKSIQTFQAINP